MACITFQGIKQNSSISSPISDELFLSIPSEFYKKPDISLVQKQLKNIANGGTKVNYVYNYFIKEVASKAIGPNASWSIDDSIHNREIMEYFHGKMEKSPHIFKKEKGFVYNLEKAFRLCGIRYCTKCPNYPLKSVQEILYRYNVNNVWYDFSCGWGTRLLGALQNNITYYGTDPNTELCTCLNDISNMYHQVNQSDTAVHIFPQGSEVLIDELVGKVGLAFSSPPYFDLEDYKIGNQSYKSGVTYEAWLENYMRATIQNIHKYLIDGGYFAINVKNFSSSSNIPGRDTRFHYLEQDVVTIAKQEGFYLYEIVPLKNIQRCHGDVKNNTSSGNKKIWLDTDERIYVFKKKE